MRCSPRRCGRRPPTSDQAAILGVGHATVERDRQQTSNEVQPAADEADEDVEDSAVSQSPPPDDEQPEPDIMAGAVRRRPGPGATQWRAWKRSAYPTVDCGCRAPLSARTGRSARGWPPSAPTIPGTRSGPGGSVPQRLPRVSRVAGTGPARCPAGRPRRCGGASTHCAPRPAHRTAGNRKCCTRTRDCRRSGTRRRAGRPRRAGSSNT